MDLKTIIVDDVYEGLRSTFLATGRGRRPDLPLGIAVTQRLLVQLNFLKDEGSTAWREVEDWLIKIKPSLVDHKPRLRNLIESAYACFLKSPHDDNFLSLEIDFDYISDALSRLGITRATIHSPPATRGDSVSLNNRAIIDLELTRKDQKLSKNLILDWISKLSGFDSSLKLQRAIEKTLKTYEKLRSRQTKHPHAYHTFLENVFSFDPPDAPMSSSSSMPANKTIIQQQSRLEQTIKDKDERLKLLQKALGEVIAERDNVQQQLETLTSSHHVLKKHFSSLQAEVEDVKYLKKTANKCESQRENFAKKLKKQKQSHSRVMVKLEQRIHFLHSKLKKARSENSKLRKWYRTVASELNDAKQKLESRQFCSVYDINLKGSSNNEYSDDVRKAAIALQCEAGVGAANVKRVIEIVGQNIFHHSFSQKLPCSQTALNMSDEGFVITNIQVAENILKSKNVTLHSDGTSRDHQKIVGHQFTLDCGDTLYLGYTPVATEDANTLLDITLNVVQTLANCYQDLSLDSSELITKEILSKVTSTMTDRAAAMKLYDKQFQEFLKSELGENVQLKFLHCNAHFLLGLSSSCEKALSSVESDIIDESGENLGRDKSQQFQDFCKDSGSVTNRVIRTTCNVLGPRGDQKNGCRSEWTTFCSDSLIPSFKSNRFNCYFQAAAALIHHHQKMLTFFTSGILHENPNRLLQSVTLDLQDVTLMCLVCAVALFYLKITGPYWKLVNSSVKYTEFHTYVESMSANFNRWSSDPTQVVDPSFKSVFGNKMSTESAEFVAVHEFVQNNDTPLICKVLSALSKEAFDVTQRQLSDFLEDGCFSNVDEAVKEQLQHCPLTNLVGESAFGDFDYDVSKRRHTSLHNRSAVHAIKRNKTMKYLETKSTGQQRHIFKIARRRGPLLRRENNIQEEKVRDAIREKFVLNQQKKIDKHMAEINRCAHIKDSVEGHGGPCQTAKDVDDLIHKLKVESKSDKQICEVLKTEIRFHKVIGGKKTLKFGSLTFMIDTLKAHLGNDEPLCKMARH